MTPLVPGMYLMKEVFEVDLPQGMSSIANVFKVISCLMGLRISL